MSYREQAENDAAEFISNYKDEIVEQISEDGDASTDIYNCYINSDAYIHENFTDKEYSLVEAANLLKELSDWKETDWGLWEGQDPEDAIKTQAAFTYTNAVVYFIITRIENINSNFDDLEDKSNLKLIEAIVKEECG